MFGEGVRVVETEAIGEEGRDDVFVSVGGVEAVAETGIDGEGGEVSVSTRGAEIIVETGIDGEGGDVLGSIEGLVL